MSGSKEFTVRAAGADKSLHRFLVGKFPLGVADLTSTAVGEWRMRKEGEAGGDQATPR